MVVTNLAKNIVGSCGSVFFILAIFRFYFHKYDHSSFNSKNGLLGRRRHYWLTYHVSVPITLTPRFLDRLRCGSDVARR
jgi:hypothetical protein